MVEVGEIPEDETPAVVVFVGGFKLGDEVGIGIRDQGDAAH